MLGAASSRPRVTVLTALPIMWGEGDPTDIVAGRAQRSPKIAALEARYDVRPIDVVTDVALADSILIVAQPRRLAPVELVAIDRFVRDGGRALIFADPDLRWQSAYPPGDPRRAPPITLLDPLLTHWGLSLGDSDGAARPMRVGQDMVNTVGAGQWRGAPPCVVGDPRRADCPIGKGRVVAIADADLLNGEGHDALLVDLVESLSATPHESNRFRTAVVAGLMIGAAALISFIRRAKRRT